MAVIIPVSVIGSDMEVPWQECARCWMQHAMDHAKEAPANGQLNDPAGSPIASAPVQIIAPRIVASTDLSKERPMKRLLLASSIAVLLLSSTAVLAAPRDHGHGGDRGHSWDRGHDRGHDNDRDGRWRDRGDHRWNDRHDGRWDDRRYYGHDNGWHRGYYRHSFRHGDRVPVVYLQPRYYVDYRAYHLAPPPPGYRWIRPVDGRFILIAATTGLIAEILGY
jgi:Ni/Co efflux regulator RcnB